MKDLFIFGIGEFAQLANYYFSNDSDYDVSGFIVDKEYLKDRIFDGLPVFSTDEFISNQNFKNSFIYIAIGYSNLNKNRIDKYNFFKNSGYNFASYVSSKSSIWPNVEIGENTFIMENNTIMPFSKIGNNVLIWVNSIIAHHMKIHDHVTITSHCAIGGNVIIEEASFLGLNCSIRNNIRIGKACVIGAGANVVKDVDAFCLVLGNPGKVVSNDTSNIKL
jgi:sugar O-acyltransferase (sialic acid O-acetyltransferase NeuD family)